MRWRRLTLRTRMTSLRQRPPAGVSCGGLGPGFTAWSTGNAGSAGCAGSPTSDSEEETEAASSGGSKGCL